MIRRIFVTSLFVAASVFSLTLSAQPFLDQGDYIPAEELETAMDAEETEFGADVNRERPGRPNRGGVICLAQNLRGRIFEARDRNARFAQREALRNCERVSRRCESLGCRRNRGW